MVFCGEIAIKYKLYREKTIFSKALKTVAIFILASHYQKQIFLVSLMLILKGQVELQAMTNCLLDL